MITGLALMAVSTLLPRRRVHREISGHHLLTQRKTVGSGGADLTGDPVTNPRIDTTVPHSARMWNYWLGGKDHYES